MELTDAFKELPTPCYLVDESLLIKNLKILDRVQQATGCRILLAQKAFSMFSLYPLIGRYLAGTTASGLFEARLGHQEMGGETHVFATAYRDDEFDEIVGLCDHIVFNSFNQWQKYKDQALRAGRECGIRINPEWSTQDHAIYDPCSPGSRMGVTRAQFKPELLEGISGLHFHTLCEQNADALEETLKAVEEKFGEFLPEMKWLNFGGGHHITRADYDIEKLIACIRRIQERYGLKVYLEPGEAVALNTGFLVATVLDLVENGIHNAILDTSAACHMPDVLEMPYRPNIIGAAQPDQKPFTYRLGGPTCLAGDIIGDYSFDKPLEIGDRLIFCDMAIYSMVKNNTFNGMNLPAIAIFTREKTIQMVKQFGYTDFKNRLS
ncbi:MULTISPECIES: carboxynorspermidine decarboxylase [Acetobacterium]|uniref:carboxynorspermidine decarboxylase n=1 Tax=Acetobacterium TaxID=33951 RepID=UPI0020342852|nr:MULTISPECIES: carboxynorspermidine decarboxylase [Acetobacterium]MEA4807520.1 carboxynorspermidine decarboxylase [Acetobacterium wieringae]URN84056.1 carboxynorspermidine decarboxylase [Acetobacterium wieringae]